MEGENFKKFAFTPKGVLTGGGIGDGEVNFNHLAPGLFSEIRNIQLHKHTGTGSPKIELQNTAGYFPRDGFLIYSTTGAKRFRLQVTDAGEITLTQV